MSDTDFLKPQRQSVVGILLIFFTSFFQIIRNFWVVGVYFVVSDVDSKIILYSLLGFFVLLFLTLGYSILAYLKFGFYIDDEKGEFILEKGVFTSQVVSIPFHKIQQVNFKRNLLQRLLAVFSMAIDTAGSNDKEVEIRALDKEKAELLGDLLMQRAEKERKLEPGEEEVEELRPENDASESLWEHELSFITLLKLGLTSNYFRGLAILLAFYFSLKEQFSFTDETLAFPDPVAMEMFSTLVLVLLLIVLGMLLTVGEIFIKYYNLKVKRSTAGLHVEMGLRENTRVTIRPQRVQLLQVLTNPIQRKLNLHKLKISLASSQDDLKKERIQIPGLPQEVVGWILGYFYDSQIPQNNLIRPHRITLLKRLFRGALPAVTVLCFWAFGYFQISSNWVVGIAIIYLVLITGYNVLYMRSLKLFNSEDFLVLYSGVWIKKKQIVQMYKLQSVSLSQPIWYRSRGLVEITFHTAGGDIRFGFIRRSKAISLMNHLLYKIESTEKAWM